MGTYFYVAADDIRNIVTGVTRNLEGAMRIHKSGRDEQTSATGLVFARAFDSLQEALEYERYFLRLSSQKRDRLITAVNPTWEDWSSDVFPANAGIAFAESVSDVLTQWLENPESESLGSDAKLPFAPFDRSCITIDGQDQSGAWTSVH